MDVPEPTGPIEPLADQPPLFHRSRAQSLNPEPNLEGLNPDFTVRDRAVSIMTR